MHAETIPGIQAKIVCGAANNQLGCEEDNQLLVEHGITYVPDFLANRMVCITEIRDGNMYRCYRTFYVDQYILSLQGLSYVITLVK